MKCAHCGEEILPGERAYVFGANLHHECSFRLAVGSVGHIQGKCTCKGGTEDEPPGMTKRQAALAAVEAFRSQGESERRMANLFDMIRRNEHIGDI